MNYRNEGSSTTARETSAIAGMTGENTGSSSSSIMAGSVNQRAQVCFQFMDKLKQLQEARHLCDLIFELRGQHFYSHRVVLAVWSPLVYSLFSKDVEVEKILVNYDNLEVFGSFLSFLYSGQMDEVGENNLIQVLHLATSLQVAGLRQACDEALKRQLNISNIISTFHVARKFRLPNLEEFALNFMQINLPEAVKQTDFLSLSPSRFNSFLSSGWVCVMKPEVKLFLIISWLGYDVKERQQYLVLLLRYIDWSIVANDFLLEISQTENFFTTNESSLYLLLQTLFSSAIPLGPYSDRFPLLREKYGYLLDHIVQNSYVLPIESDEYFPVSFHFVHSTQSSHRLNSEQQQKTMNTLNSDCLGKDGSLENSANSSKKITESVVTSPSEDSGTSWGKSFTRVSTVLPVSGKSIGSEKMQAVEKSSHITSTKSHSFPPATTAGSIRRKRGRPRKVVEVAKETCETPQNSTAALNVHPLNTNSMSLNDFTKHKPKINLGKKNRKENVLKAQEKPSCFNETSAQIRNTRPKRKAAAMFSVPQKLIPRQKIKKKNPPDLQDINQTESNTDEDSKNNEVSIDDSSDNSQNFDYSCYDADFTTSLKKGDKLKVDKQLQTKHFNSRPKKLQQANTKNKTCDECNYVAPTSGRLTHHIQRVHCNNKSTFTCSICQFDCSWNKKYYSHMREHFAGPPFACDEEGCGFTVDRIQLLLVHRRRHSDERPFVCTQCSSSFRTRNNLQAHLKCHSDDKNYECPVCHRRFKMKITMEQHLVTHSDVRPYLCDTCGFSTKFQSHLISHKRIHTGEVFHCGFPMCSYSSPKRSQLKAHMRSHLNIRHHTCSTCQKSFIEKSHLVRHLKIHQDERPFKCDQCDYSSTRADKLHEHVQKHHSENYSAKRKWTTRKKKSTASSLNSLSTTVMPAVTALSKDEHWDASVEGSIDTLACAAEEVRLATRSSQEVTIGMRELYNSVDMQPTSVHQPLQTDPVQLEPLQTEPMQRSDLLSRGMHSTEIERENYVAVRFEPEVSVSEATIQKEMESGLTLLSSNPSRNLSLTSLTSPPTRHHLTYEMLQQHHHNQQQHLQPQQQSPEVQQHASATLLQQLAMSVGAAATSLQPRHLATLSVPVMDSNSNPMLLTHTAPADMTAASNLLLSAMQQHAAASAADSLASLSYGMVPHVVQGQLGHGMQSQQQLLHEAGVTVQLSQQSMQQQMVNQHSEQSQQQTDRSQSDYTGLTAFMTMF